MDDALLIIPTVLVLLLAGAVFWSGGAGEEKADFTFINRGEIGTLDPNRMSWLEDIRIGYALWEGLYTLHPETLEPIPGAADRIDVSDDKTVYTFHIRPDAKWSNGETVKSGDFVFAWRRMLEEPGDYTSLLFYIRGARDYSTGFSETLKSGASRVPDFQNVGIKAPDSATLQVTLEHPVTFFPDLCAFPPMFPLHEKSMERFRQKDEKTGRLTYRGDFTRPGNLVSNGPYRLAKWDFKRRVRLEASLHYWDRANVRSKVIEIVSAEDPWIAFQKYDTGAVDWLTAPPGDIAAELKKKDRSDLHVFPGFGTYFYSFNCRKTGPDGQPNPFADSRVRQALAMAIDRRAIVENITRMGERPAANYIPPGIFNGYHAAPGLEMDLTKARQLLADAGYPDGRGFPAFSILFNNEGQHPPIAQFIGQQWAENLGLNVEMQGMEIKVFRERLHKKDYLVARASWIGDYNDPSTFTDKYLSDSENNDSDWVNPRYDELCRTAAREGDAARRLAMLAEAEDLLNREMPIIPLYYYVNSYIYRDNVKGISLSPRNMVMLQAVHAER